MCNVELRVKVDLDLDLLELKERQATERSCFSRSLSSTANLRRISEINGYMAAIQSTAMGWKQGDC
jgi:hypothetical protein